MLLLALFRQRITHSDHHSIDMDNHSEIVVTYTTVVTNLLLKNVLGLISAQINNLASEV